METTKVLGGYSVVIFDAGGEGKQYGNSKIRGLFGGEASITVGRKGRQSAGNR